MAKGSQFWGHASGKLGEQVLYRAGGEQRSRSYTKNVKNPKTVAQMRNRIMMGNLVAVFDALRPIIRNSFPNRVSKQSGWNAFVAANKNADTPIIDPAFNGTGISVPYKVQISKGNILVPSIGMFQSGGSDAFGIQFPFPPGFDDASYEGTGALTKSNYLDMLQSMNLPNDTKMTVALAVYADEGFEIKSVTVDQNSIGNLSLIGVSLSIASVAPGLALTIGDASPKKMMAILFSYTDANGKLQVSTSRFELLGDSLEYVEDYLPGGAIYERVLEKSIGTQEDVLSTR